MPVRLDWKKLFLNTSDASGASDSSTASADSSSNRSPRRPLVILLAGVLAMALVVGGVLLVRQHSGADFRLAGASAGGVVNASAVGKGGLEVTAPEGEGLHGAEVTVDGKRVPVTTTGRHLTVGLDGLRDGTHELKVATEGSVLGGSELTRELKVDTTPPKLAVADTEGRSLRGPVTVKGRAQDAAEVTVAGRTARVGKDGAFAVTLPRPPAKATAVATDEAGNTAREDAVITVRRPTMRAVHVSGQAWASDQLRKPVLKLLKEHKINAVQLDIKDELGEISYDSKVPLAKKIGAAKGYYDAKKAIKEIHAAGGAVVGRIVAFRDPVLASASWKDGHRDRVVRTPDGGPYGAGSKYGSLSFTNFANKDVRQYHLDLAAEAAKLGFDDILYDYIRRPDGKLSSMSFPGLGKTSPEDSIAGLVARTRAVAREHGAFLGVSVFGVAVTRPKEIAQDIGKFAKQCDYIAPMVYPSHWAEGEYGVSDPNSHPYPITKKSLADFVKKTRHTDAQIVPWLQDFSLGVSYGDAEVAAQIRAAEDDGIHSFLLWNPAVRYHGGALKPMK
ncbi:putative glycoside hydrolase [Streptomyces sp. NPDC047117]|uniref:putative glycoside hydrolase n=1 Tax=Streptomyces sp. NPDC047117 TaxID=3155379 RepID=UPI0033D1F346